MINLIATLVLALVMLLGFALFGGEWIERTAQSEADRKARALRIVNEHSLIEELPDE